MLGPASWVMVHELGYRLHLRGARWSEFRGLMKISVYVFLIQLSVVLADRIDNHAKEFVELRDEIKGLRRALYTFALSIAGGAVAVVWAATQVLG